MPNPFGKHVMRILSRRTFVRTSLLATGLITLPFPNLFKSLFAGCNFPSIQLATMTDAELSRLIYLTPKEFVILNAIADRILPSDKGRRLPAASALKTIERLDKIIPLKLDSASQKDFKMLIGFFDSLSLGGFVTYSNEQKDRYLNEWMKSSIALFREGFRALKKLIVTSYFSNEAVWPLIGYEGPYPVVEWTQKDPTDVAISPLLPPIEYLTDREIMHKG